MFPQVNGTEAMNMRARQPGLVYYERAGACAFMVGCLAVQYCRVPHRFEKEVSKLALRIML